MLPSQHTRFSNDVGAGPGSGSIFSPGPPGMMQKRGAPIMQRPMPGMSGGGGASGISTPTPQSPPNYSGAPAARTVPNSPAVPGGVGSIFSPGRRTAVL